MRRSFLEAVTGDFNGIKNYQSVFQNQAFLLAVKNTFRFTLVGIPLLVLSGFAAALLLSSLKKKGWIKSLYLFPLAMPTATIVLVWKMTFYKEGFLNLFLTRIGEWTGLWGGIHTDYLGTEAAFWVLVCSYIWKIQAIRWYCGWPGFWEFPRI